MIGFALLLFILIVSPFKFEAVVNNADEEWESKLADGTARQLKTIFKWKYGKQCIIDDVNFYLYTQDRLSDPVKSKVTDSVLFDGEFDKMKPVKILIHGYKSSRNELFAKTLRKAYLQSSSYNIITAEWSLLSKKMYPMARGFVPGVGKIVARFIDKLINQTGLRADQLHVLGHSMGAHVAGVAGLNVQSGKLKRITGLDPAGPLFRCKDDDRLQPRCAKFVDIIHTAANRLGFHEALGHIDFYPNEGTSPQPGCDNDYRGLCSHSRSVLLYAESIASPNAFFGTQCDDWEKYVKGDCDMNPSARMGEFVSFFKPGKYWMRTRESSPYGFGPFPTNDRVTTKKPSKMQKVVSVVTWPVKYWSSYIW